MGRKGSTWFNALKKAFYHSNSKDSASEEPRPLNIHDTPSHYCVLTEGKKDVNIALQEKRSIKEKNRWSFRRSSNSALQSTDQLHYPRGNDHSQSVQLPNTVASDNPCPTHFENKYGHGERQNKQVVAVAVATAAAAEAAVAAAQAAAHAAKLSGNGRSGRNGIYPTPRSSKFSRQSKEELAAIRIQSAFRAFLARRTLRTLKGLARLQSLAQGRVGQRQTTATMRSMQALVRAQAAVRGRRTTRLLEDSDAAAMIWDPTWERWPEQSPLASEKGEQGRDDPNRQRDPDWDSSTQTIEQIRARELSKQEAAVKRERSMAYAFSHQQLNGTSLHQYGNKANTTTPQLGWNWLERWMAAKPWENRRPVPAAKEAATRASTPPPRSSFLPRQSSPLRRGSAPATPGPGPPASFRQSTTPRTASPAQRAPAFTPLFSSFSGPATSRLTTVPPLISASTRAHSLASSLQDDLSVASFSGTPSYMATTESARAKLRSHSTPKQRPSGARSAATSIHSDDVQRAGQQPPARKRLSFINGADKGGSARHFLSWRGSSTPLQRNFSFEGR